MSVWIFRFALTAALLVTALVYVFFIWGLADGSVSWFNMGLWLGLLAGVSVVPLVGWRLRKHGKLWLSISALSLLAVPGFLYGLFFVLIFATGARWN